MLLAIPEARRCKIGVPADLVPDKGCLLQMTIQSLIGGNKVFVCGLFL